MAVAGLLFAAFSQSRSQNDRAYPAVASSTAFALDAIGSGALFFHPSERAPTQYEREGGWSSTPGCPAGLAVLLGGREYPVSPEGRLEREAGEWVCEQLTAPERVRAAARGPDPKSVRPSAAQRCVWARRQGRALPPGQCPFFGWVLGEPAQTVLEPAPPAAPRQATFPGAGRAGPKTFADFRSRLARSGRSKRNPKEDEWLRTPAS